MTNTVRFELIPPTLHNGIGRMASDFYVKVLVAETLGEAYQALRGDYSDARPATKADLIGTRQLIDRDNNIYEIQDQYIVSFLVV